MNLIATTDHDDAAFIALINEVLNGAIECYKPSEMYIIHIDTWFDYWWTTYSGRIGYCCNVRLNPLTPPPFSPNRARSQQTFKVSEADRFVFDRTKAPALHIHQHSAENSHHRLKNITPSGLYLWYSGNTQNTDRGSLMVYSVQEDLNVGWYVTLLKRGEWKFGQTTGISKEEIQWLRKKSTSQAQEDAGSESVGPSA